MGNRIIRVIFILFFSFFFTVETWGEGESYIEQVFINMPKIDIYLHGQSNVEKSDIKAYLDKKVLSLSNVEKFNKEKSNCQYYFLVDISASIPDSEFIKIKKELGKFSNQLGKAETWTLISFGNTGTVVFKEKKAFYNAQKVIEKLENNDANTVLFKTLMDVAGMVDRTKDQRVILVLITDGEDFSKGVATKEEAFKCLKKKNIPVYAQGIETEEKNNVQNLNSLGEFARKTGGAYEKFSSFSKLKKNLDRTTIVTFQNKNNVVSHKEEKLRVEIKKFGLNEEVIVIPENYQKSKQKLCIKSVTKKTENQLEIVFNQDVLYADKINSYDIQYKNKKGIAVKEAVYQKEKHRAILTLDEKIYSGIYNIQCINVKSNTMEQVRCPSYTVKLIGINPYLKYMVLFLSIISVCGIFGIILWRVICRNYGIIVANKKIYLEKQLDYKNQHVFIYSKKEYKIRVTLSIYKEMIFLKDITVDLIQSIIVGRNQTSDIYFDDEYMSRQHFAIENRKGNLYLINLSESNGTKVNGIAIWKEQKLRPNDRVSAGEYVFIIKF